jgi:spore coat protein U-like protein
VKRIRNPYGLALGATVFLGISLPVSAQEVTTANFDITMTIEATCNVAAGSGSDIALGSVPSSATNTTGNSNITVNCTSSTPYFIGLEPSNAASSGAGELSGTGGNTDTIPYQLSSTPGPSGTVWGNTATSASVGNGVAGTGNGADQTITVYATVPNANFSPDSYSDTVTVNVNY